MWELIHNLAQNKIKVNLIPPKLISSSGEIITEGNTVCDLFNSFFASIGQELANKIPDKYHINSGNTLMYEENQTHKITRNDFTPCSTTEIKKIIDDLDANTSSGLDEITTKAIKCLKDVIAERLTSCINECLVRGSFPDSLKLAKVSPIYKSGSKTDPSNHRPVSVLPVISKFFERILYTRLNDYLTEKQFFIPEQYGLRPNSGTLTATIDLITKIKTNIDQKKHCCWYFHRYEKSFRYRKSYKTITETT